MGAHSPSPGTSGLSPVQFIGPRNMINRLEYTRLLEQALVQLGYHEVAAQLEQASGVEMQPHTATAFRDAVFKGNFQGALDILPQLATTHDSLQRARHLLLRHKYIEAIAAGDLPGALHCLRHELQPLQSQADAGFGPYDRIGGVQSLTAMLVSGISPINGGQPVPSASGREALLAELQSLLPPSLLVPESRLEELIEQALLAQLERCPYHNSRGLRMSLFTDYTAGPEQLPTCTAQVLDAHSDEVWAVQFSSDGRWMATASKDGSALLWAVTDAGEVRLERALLREGAPVSIVAFSPNSKRLLATGSDGRLRVYAVPSGDVALEVQILAAGTEGLSTAAWLPDSRRVVMAAGGRELQLIDVETGGAVLDRWSLGQHTYDAVLSRDGSACVTVGQDRRLRFLRFADKREVFVGPEPAAVTCLSASGDGRFLAANLANGVVHLWPLGDMAAPEGQTVTHRQGAADPMDALPAAPVQELRAGEGPPGRFVIRSAFGGAGSAFVASGSERGHVHIWHRESGELLVSLSGHEGSVNGVAWNPRNQYMLASASDDRTVRIWRAPAAVNSK